MGNGTGRMALCVFISQCMRHALRVFFFFSIRVTKWVIHHRLVRATWYAWNMILYDSLMYTLGDR